jgi:protein archease
MRMYRELEHTGDLAIEVTGASRERLFANSLVAMARLMVERDGVGGSEHRELRIITDTDADLLHDLLAAALNLFLIDGFIWRRAKVASGDGEVSATLTGETFDRGRHHLLEEIKAVTYHNLTVERAGTGWRAVVVFDA